MPSLKVTVIAALMPLLAGCATSGLYNMSDEWCAVHASASPARCPDEPVRAALAAPARVARNDAQHGD